MAEQAMLHALTNAALHPESGDPLLCHGYAGLVHIAARTAADADPDATRCLRARLPALLRVVSAAASSDEELEPALLEGTTGIALVLSNAAAVPRTSWDACLLVT